VSAARALQIVKLEAITTLEGADYVRDQVDAERVAEFTELYAGQVDDTSPLPPLLVVDDGEGGLLLASGRHRLEAAHAAGLEELLAEVHRAVAGEDAAAVAYRLSVEADARSAKPLTREEKRRAVDRLLEEFPAATDHRIAAMAGVSHVMVTRRRDSSESIATGGDEPTNGNGHGERTTMGTSAEVIPLALHELCFDHTAGRLRRDPKTIGRELAAGVRTYWLDAGVDEDQQRRGLELISKALAATAIELESGK
jgi:hypothetical protein